MEYEQLKLSNQVCFPVYALSRLITREYQPCLDDLGITYPQYLVLMVLWEKDAIPVSEITRKLILNTNTITPLLKRMESQGLITRVRSATDERKVLVNLTPEGLSLQYKASSIPEKLVQRLLDQKIGIQKLMDLRDNMHQLICLLNITY